MHAHVSYIKQLRILIAMQHMHVRALRAGADLGFSERGAKHSSGSLHDPPEAIEYFVL